MYLLDKKNRRMGSGVFLSFFLFFAAFGLPNFSFEWQILERQPSKGREESKRGNRKGNKRRETKDTSHSFFGKSASSKSNIHKKRTHTLSLKRRNTRAQARELLEREKERKKKNTERSFPSHSFLPSSPSILRAEEEEEHGEHGRARNN